MTIFCTELYSTTILKKCFPGSLTPLVGCFTLRAAIVNHKLNSIYQNTPISPGLLSLNLNKIFF